MSEIDRQLEAAWRAASREEPSEALDASIRAAARRAVAARQGQAKPASWWRVKTHWVPLAATAVMAVLAVGLVQLTPPERVDPALTAERPAAGPAVDRAASKPVAPAASAISETARADDESSPEVLAKERADQLERKGLAQQAANSAAEKKRAAFPAQPPPAELQPAANSGAAVTTPSEARQPRAAQAEPFPAAPQFAVPGAAATSTPANTSRREAAAEDAGAVSATAAPAPAAALRDFRPESKSQLESAPEATPARQSEMARLAASSRLPSQNVALRSADDWIKWIRKLRAEGKSEEAAKELAAFRAAYGERAQELLPADLREIKP